MPLLKPTYIEYEQLNTLPRYNVIGKYAQKCRPKAARGRKMEGEYACTRNILDRNRGGDEIATDLQWSGGILGAWVIREFTGLLHDALHG